jgi:hypothetical protein
MRGLGSHRRTLVQGAVVTTATVLLSPSGAGNRTASRSGLPCLSLAGSLPGESPVRGQAPRRAAYLRGATDPNAQHFHRRDSCER